MFGIMEAMLSFLRRQVGLRTDAADSEGSLHAKVTDLPNTIWSASNRTLTAPAGVVKSLQTGTSSIPDDTSTVNVTISTVNTAKTVVFISVKADYKDDAGIAAGFVRARLTSATNLELYHRYDPDYASAVSVAWQVVEFY